MKIFISHNSKDKPAVEQYASALSKVYGMQSIFYDSWSIQPGDGIVDKMNSGLDACDFFIFFISVNSLASVMVKIEWQNALISEARGDLRFIPVKLDSCKMPALLRQKLYIDVPSVGEELAIRQLFDVISGRNTYRKSESDRFHNLKAYARTAAEPFRVDLEIRAAVITEPISRYCVILRNKDAHMWATSDYMTQSGRGSATASDGSSLYAYYISIDRATAPRFPFRIAITDNCAIEVAGVMHAVGENEYEKVPIIVVLSKDVFGFNADIEVPIDDVVGSDITQQETFRYMVKKIADIQSD